ncbi:hypothetical protein BDN70DRAFT_40904 [Pholiota conissans]|uniref:Inner centromere protein ARK-binding domain-containing protein n=1 Tax=Pholiota conissans TaxID=109636 RepID=A0A9P5Z0F8_9AGAR|nr:hypothetical protein BDN70DRAFT_40904 [Pholiota conissans]
MDHPGLLSWANSICLTMASDPCRQVFKDQVQTHGFMFLEDYLDNIVSGKMADPLIELVKTPGRKKAISRKPKLMSSKLVNSIVSEGNILDENVAPINSFQVALGKLKTPHAALVNLTEQESLSERELLTNSQRFPFTSLQSVTNTSNGSSDSRIDLASPAVVHPALEPFPHANADHNNLSVIDEDEEPSERIRTSPSNLSKVVATSAVHADTQVLPSISDPSLGSSQSGSNMASTSSMETFEFIPLCSPKTDIEQNAEHRQTSVEADGTPACGPALRTPETLLIKSSKDVPDSVMTDAQEDGVLTERKLSDRPVVPLFPTLPGPLPLRKSMRAPRDPSLTAVMLGAATPGATTSKRTSWLAKAREVKALEAPAKKPSIPVPISNPTTISSFPQGTKRKSEDMLSMPPLMPEDERRPKTPKLADGDIMDPSQHDEYAQQEGVLDRLKKTVEGFGVRVGKTMSKSVGGGAASALAEARAAAEARIAERDRNEDETTMVSGLPHARVDVLPQNIGEKMSTVLRNEDRLSISDLFPADGRVKGKHKSSDRPFQFTPSFVPTSTKESKENAIAHERTSTPTHSLPPKNHPLPPTPVFNRPPPVFVPPTTSVFTQQPVFNAPPLAPKYTVPPSIALGFSPRLPSPSSPRIQTKMPLTAHSTLDSVQSNIFDQDDIPAWVPSTQDTEYTSGYDSQSQPRTTQICDEDDSWPIDEKLSAGVQWTFGESKDDSMTWSTFPSQSQRGANTGPITRVSSIQEKESATANEASQKIPSTFDMDTDLRQAVDESSEGRDTELDEIITGTSQSVIATVEPKIPRSQSQMSMTSSESSQSQVSLLGQTSKLFNALGTGKKKQPEVKKVLQMAASAAKKQQEEADKKAARLKEMDNRRQLALQRKAEEEKAKALEEERKVKEEIERRKKEREDLTDKRSLKPSSKRDEESNKKRKVEPEKKQELKKHGASLIGKAHLKTALKQPNATNFNNTFGCGLSQTPAYASGSADASSSHKGKGVAHQTPEDDVSQPSQLVQSQMAARAKAQIDAAKPQIASENIELPDINSEYSDSEDEDRPRTFDPPDWAQSPELRQALETQSTINPDDIFGAVRPLKMEEIFKTRTSRFRPRSSSANWTGSDRLTLQEEKDYAKRMGFK